MTKRNVCGVVLAASLSAAAHAEIVAVDGPQNDRAYVEYFAETGKDGTLEVKYRLRCERLGAGETQARAFITFFVFNQSGEFAEEIQFNDYCSVSGAGGSDEPALSSNDLLSVSFPGYSQFDLAAAGDGSAPIILHGAIDRSTNKLWEETGVPKALYQTLAEAREEIVNR